MFRAGIAFNFLNIDTTQSLRAVYLEVASARPKVKLPSFNRMRTVMLDVIYLKIQKEVFSLTACWDTSGCTFITDGSTDRRNRPMMNFLAAGEQGAMLVVTVTMTGRKKNATTLARLWEQVTREIGLKCINAICTDNAEVNKKAAQILERRKEKDLLLKDLANLSWIKGTVKTANTIVKFIRNHHATNELMMSIDDTKSLLRPAEVRFGSVYMMLQHLEDREDVLTEMVDGKEAAKWRSLRWSGEKLRRKEDLVYYTVRSESWWPEVKKIVSIMRPVYELLKRMDAKGTSPTNLVEYDELIARRLRNVVLEKVGGEWNSKAHSDIWADLMEFHKEPGKQAHTNLEPGKAPKKRKDEHMWKRVAKDDASRLTPAAWWAAHGGDVPDLQKIAVKVMGMWSTATPAERNWTSMDFVHSKRRNSLSPESSRKKEEEERRIRTMAKAPRGRIPKDLFQSDSSGSSDLEDLVWKGKCWNEFSSEDCSEEGGDSDFELDEAPTVPATTCRQAVDTDVEFLLHPHDDPDEEEAARAKAMADWDAELVEHRMHAQEARRAALPTRRERERNAAQQNKHTDDPANEVDVEDEENIATHTEENVAQQRGDEGQPVDESRAQQGIGVTEPAMERTRPQQEEASEAGKEQPVRGLVYVCRPRPHADQEMGVEEQKQASRPQ
ncbi:hypothetical protein CBR_g88553 [Chara braunii]|uniref:DUF659 domain-containing protein n=1 Tax=Chara braunii TaxID=69332 RepID=A0A388KB22_CHABU|nr:hypothetical protein CBR_g88553 [Chara braunii]|eukprot:GBG67264.1 hypothetical protein CBR_g88553 [Chara braunii]